MSNKPHKWAEVIKAWADGAEVQFKHGSLDKLWRNYTPGDTPSWGQGDLEFRVKPKKKSPGQVYFETAYGDTWASVGEYMRKKYEEGAQGVINAYKAGEIE